VTPSRPSILVCLVIVAAATTWTVVHFTYASLPPLPWTMVPSLLLLALAETYTGVLTRARIQRKPDTKPIEPLATARLAALAKASSHSAALLAGVFGGIAIYLSSSLDKLVPRRDFFVGGGTFLASVALIGAALFLEYACRVPKGPGDKEEENKMPA
jgi:Protein of unknown function (DUF3180)